MQISSPENNQLIHRLSGGIVALTIAFVVGIVFFVTALPAQAATTIIYVDAGAGGTNDGSSWTDAYTSLQDALGDTTAIPPGAGDDVEIWVAAGTYTPSTTFQLVNSVAIYGGFAGGETLLSERDPNPATNGTVLSGDIGTPGDASDNSYHVVTGSGVTTGTVLDGFTVEGGYADGGGIDDDGGGIRSDGGSLTLQNLIIQDNFADSEGGGIYANDSTVVLTNVTISNNEAVRGSGVYNISSDGTYTDVVISDNLSSAIGLGGGVFNTDISGSVSFTNVTIAGNQATNGGGVFNDNISGSVSFTNVTISNNTAIEAFGTGGFGGGVINTDSSGSVSFTNAAISGNQSTNDGGGVFNANSSGSVSFTNAAISGNQSTNGGGVFNGNDSPTFTNVTIAGNQATNGGGVFNELNSNPDFQNSIIWGNDASTGPQVNDQGGSTPTYTYSLVQGLNLGGTNLDGTTATADFVAPEAASNAPTTAGNYRLQSTSDAIDAGDDSANSSTTDLDGNPRKNGTIDLGAYEFSVTPTPVSASVDFRLWNWLVWLGLVAFAAWGFRRHKMA